MLSTSNEASSVVDCPAMRMHPVAASVGRQRQQGTEEFSIPAPQPQLCGNKGSSGERRTVHDEAAVTFTKQCAADSTAFGAISVPPHS